MPSASGLTAPGVSSAPRAPNWTRIRCFRPVRERPTGRSWLLRRRCWTLWTRPRGRRTSSGSSAPGATCGKGRPSLSRPLPMEKRWRISVSSRLPRSERWATNTSICTAAIPVRSTAWTSPTPPSGTPMPIRPAAPGRAAAFWSMPAARSFPGMAPRWNSISAITTPTARWRRSTASGMSSIIAHRATSVLPARRWSPRWPSRPMKSRWPKAAPCISPPSIRTRVPSR